MSEGLLLGGWAPNWGWFIVHIYFNHSNAISRLSFSHHRPLKPIHMIVNKMSSSIEMQSFSTTLTLVVLAGAVYTIAPGIWRLYFSPIAKFPGPKLAALTYGTKPTTTYFAVANTSGKSRSSTKNMVQPLASTHTSNMCLTPNPIMLFTLEGQIIENVTHDTRPALHSKAAYLPVLRMISIAKEEMHLRHSSPRKAQGDCCRLYKNGLILWSDD